MTANELRIGNYLYYHIVDNLDERKEWNEINAVDAEDILDISDGRGEDLGPIPLTEEWLIKFGFIKNHKAFVTYERVLDYNTSLTLFKDHEDGVYSMVVILTQQLDEEDYQEIVLENTSFVHQLQNLYFALTGKELKIKII